MSEEEKKLVVKFKNLYIKDFNGEPITVDDRLSYIECALITNLIEKLDKELNNIKEIEKLHKEENGKLREELEQEIEKNKELVTITYGIRLLETNGVSDDTYYLIAKRDFLKGSYKKLLTDYISKDKIKELIENEIIDISGFRCIAVEDIENLLEEK